MTQRIDKPLTIRPLHLTSRARSLLPPSPPNHLCMLLVSPSCLLPRLPPSPSVHAVHSRAHTLHHRAGYNLYIAIDREAFDDPMFQHGVASRCVRRAQREQGREGISRGRAARAADRERGGDH